MGYMGPLFCNDCGIDTYREVEREWYHVRNEVWESTGLSAHASGFLCIGCLETRLGRQLLPTDFDGYDPDPRDSLRLRDRRDGFDGNKL